ncbi:MAG: Rrf2 family transcriptional regulator [Patescibacteria group bacterium]
MIKISTKSQYGLRAMVYLARQSDWVSARLIAESEGIPVNFLEKVLGRLKKAGLVKVKRGVEGGYQLLGSPRRITVGDVVRPLEGKMAMALCLDKNNTLKCPRANGCLTKNVWARVQNSLNESLDSISLYSLIK